MPIVIKIKEAKPVVYHGVKFVDGIATLEGTREQHEGLLTLLTTYHAAEVVLPEPAAAPVEVSGGQDEVEKDRMLSALSKLDHKNDAHWAGKGKPDLGVVEEYFGSPVTRKMIEQYAPEFVRVK